jgi:HK97 family phage major capsid protein
VANITEIREKHTAAIKTARAYIDGLKAKGEDVTDAELAEADRLTKTVSEWTSKLDGARALDDLTRGLTGADGDQSFTGGTTAGRWAKSAVDAMRQRTGSVGLKALVGGDVDLPKVIADPVPLTERPNDVLQLIPTAPFGAGDGEFGASHFTLLRQTERTNNATAVADGQLKPESTYGWDDAEDRVRVYAHLSEELPEHFLTDYSKLVQLMQSEMYTGLQSAIERDVVGGPVQGPGVERFTGLLNTPGIRTVAAASDLITTLSNGLYALAIDGDKPNAWIMHPADVQRLLLLRENGTTGALLFNSGRTSLEQILGNLPIVQSPRIPAGTALVGDFQQTRLVVRDQTSMQVDRSGARFDRNLVRFRLETRVGFVVLRPASFAKVTLPAS